MSLAVLPDLRVLHTARTGQVRIHDPRTGLNTLAAEVPIYQHDEEGLHRIAIDPDFSRNHWVYCTTHRRWTPRSTTRPPPRSTGRRALRGHRGGLGCPPRYAPPVPLQAGRRRSTSAPSSRSTWPSTAASVFIGSQIDFDGRGNLFLSTGDDCNPFFSDGYAP
jgi:glucose/arabinose dehydrogenase